MTLQQRQSAFYHLTSLLELGSLSERDYRLAASIIGMPIADVEIGISRIRAMDGINPRGWEYAH